MELLIVIVVIAILAAITIVAYNGIQNRAKSSAGQTLARQVADKARVYQTLSGSGYPSSIADFATFEESALSDSNAVLDIWSGVNQNIPQTYSDGKKVVYATDPGGGCILWWDYAASSPSKKAIPLGSSNCSGW